MSDRGEASREREYGDVRLRHVHVSVAHRRELHAVVHYAASGERNTCAVVRKWNHWFLAADALLHVGRISHVLVGECLGTCAGARGCVRGVRWHWAESDAVACVDLV